MRRREKRQVYEKEKEATSVREGERSDIYAMAHRMLVGLIRRNHLSRTEEPLGEVSEGCKVGQTQKTFVPNSEWNLMRSTIVFRAP